MKAIPKLQLGQLLTTLLLLGLFGPAVSEMPYGYAAVVILSFLVLVACLGTIDRGDPRRRIGMALAAPICIITLLTVVLRTKWLAVIDHLLLIAFLALIIRVLLEHVMSQRKVSEDIIGAGLAIYLLVGVLFADIYALMELVAPGSFNLGEHLANLESASTHTRVYSTRLIYYSLVTLTTLGYGDITPVSTLAQSFSAVEAVIGPVFLAVFIGELIGTRVAQRTGSTPD